MLRLTLVDWYSHDAIQGKGDHICGLRDGRNGGVVFMNIISLAEEKFVLVIEAERSNLGSAMKQLLLSLKDMRDRLLTCTLPWLLPYAGRGYLAKKKKKKKKVTYP